MGAHLPAKVQIQRVAQLPLVAVAEEVAVKASARLERSPARVPLGRRGRVRRLIVFALSVLGAELVDRVRAEDRRIPDRDVQVVAVQLLSVRDVRDAADTEVVLTVALVLDLRRELVRVRERLVEAAVTERLVERVLDVRRKRLEGALRPEEDRGRRVDLLEGREEMGLILDDRAAQCEAELVTLVADVRVLLERALGAQRVAAVEAEERARERVRSGFRQDRERAARGAADLGVEAVVDDAELRDRVLRELRLRKAERRVREVDAVHEDRRLARVAAPADDRAAGDEAEGAALALDAGRHEREPLEVAVRRREVLDLLRRDVRRGVRLVDVHERRRRDDADALGPLALERRAHARALADEEDDALLLDGLEALKLHRHVVRAGRKRRERREAARARDARAGKPGVRALHLDGHAGKRSATPVHGHDVERRRRRLCGGGERRERQNQYGDGHEPRARPREPHAIHHVVLLQCRASGKIPNSRYVLTIPAEKPDCQAETPQGALTPALRGGPSGAPGPAIGPGSPAFR